MRIKSAPSAVQPYPRYASCVSVKDYGARGDGTVDDAPAIQRAVNSVAAGCSVLFPPGTYSIRTWIIISKDLIFQLSPQTTLRFDADVAIAPDVANSRSLTVQGEGPGTSVILGAFSSAFGPFQKSDTNRFKELHIRNIEIRHQPPIGSYALIIQQPSNVYEISSCLLANLSGIVALYVSSDQYVGSSISVVDTEIRSFVRWFLYCPSVVIRGLRVISNQMGNSQIAFQVDNIVTQSNVVVQDVTFESTVTGPEDFYGIQLLSFSSGKMKAIIQSVYNTRGTRFLSADAYGGITEVTLLGSTFRRSSALYSPISLNDLSGAGQIHFRMVGCSFVQEGAANAFPVVSKSLAASSSFVEVGNYQRGWSEI
jgi:hypothetical protein